jgi:hypothetical protein
LGVLTVVVPTKTYYYTVEVPHEEQESYFEKEPYDEQESYVVQVPYEKMETYMDTVPVQVSVPYITYEDTINQAPPGRYYPSCTDPCRCTEYDWLGNCIECTCTYAVQQYRTETEQQTIQKTRPVTKYREETRLRTVTRYRDVQKERTVLRMGEEQRQYEVNWLFGFRSPWLLHIPYLSYRPQTT